MLTKFQQSLNSILFFRELFIAFAINLGVVLLIFIFRGHYPPVLPLYFGEPLGEGELAKNIFLTVPPLIVLAIIFINGFIINTIKDGFAQKILVGLVYAGTLLSLITVIRISLLVGSF